MTNEELINKAAALIDFKKLGKAAATAGNVGCVLETGNGNLYEGVCVDTGSGMGFCAEHTAISQMLTKREYTIKKIVAVWKDYNGDVYVIPPCGRCREFIKQTTESNLETEVILDKAKTVKLRELLPFHDWWKKQD